MNDRARGAVTAWVGVISRRWLLRGDIMGAAFTFVQIPGVRVCLVGDAQGRVLEESGAQPGDSGLLAAAVALSTDIGRLGSLLGLGTVEFVTTKAPSASWVIGREAEGSIAVRVDSGRPTAPVESALRTIKWHSSAEWEISTSEIECVTSADFFSGPKTLPVMVEPPPSSGRGDRGESKWRAGPKYRHVMMRAHSGRVDFTPREVPTSPSPFSVIAAAPTPPAAPTNAPTFEGDLTMFALADLIEFLGNARRTGALTCRSKGRAGTIHLCSGKVVAAVCTASKGLREHLLTRARQAGSPRPTLPEASSDLWSRAQCAATLVKDALVTVSEARSALDEQLRDTIAELLSWAEGDFSFEPQRAPDASALDSNLEFDPQGLLLEILRTQDERAAAVSRAQR